MALSFDSITSLLLVDVSLGPKTIQLPYASERSGRVFTIKDSGFCNKVNYITILCAGEDKFESGSSTYRINISNSYITISSDPSSPGWKIVARSEINLVQELTDVFTINLSSLHANLSTISTNNIDTNNISATNVTIHSAYLTNAYIENLSANVFFVNIVSTAITQDITGLTADTAYISSATISSLNAYSTFISQLYVHDIRVSDTTTLSNTLGVVGATTLSNTLGVVGATTLSNTLGVVGATTLSNTLRVAEATTLSNTLRVAEATTLSNTLGVAGATILSNTLSVAEATILSNTLGVVGVTTLSNTLGVAGATTLSNTLGVAGATTLSNTLGVAGATTLSNTLGVAGATTLSNTLGVVGVTTLSNTLGVVGVTTLSNTLGVAGVTTLSNALGVAGVTTLSNALSVAEATTLSNTLGVVGVTTLSNTLGVVGVTTLSNTLGVAGATTLSNTLGVVGVTTLSNTLGVAGATTLSNTLGVVGVTTLSNTLGVVGVTTLSNTLGVVGVTTLSNTLGVAGATTLSNTLQVGVDDATNSQLRVYGGIYGNKSLLYTDIINSTNLSDKCQIQLNNQTGRLYIGNAYTAGVGKASIIQSSDFFDNIDHGTSLLLNPLVGKVGIGKTDPTCALDVNGDVSVSGRINGSSFRSMGGGYTILSTDNYARIGFSNYGGGSGTGYSQYNSPYGHQWNRDYNVMMDLDADSNLSVNGSIKSFRNGSSDSSHLTSGEKYDNIVLRSTYDMGFLQGKTSILFGSSHTNGYYARIYAKDETVSGVAWAGSLSFQTANNRVLLNRMTIDKAGNVGIGTTAPVCALDVNGTITTNGGSISLVSNQLNNLLGAPMDGLGYYNETLPGFSGFPLKFGGFMGTVLSSGNGGGLSYPYSMVVKDGNVGVGVKNPTAKFQVIGNTNSNIVGGLIIPAIITTPGENLNTVLSVLDYLTKNTTVNVMMEIGSANADVGDIYSVYKYLMGVSFTTGNPVNGGDFIIQAASVSGSYSTYSLKTILKLNRNQLAIGLNAGLTSQGANAIAIGSNAGKTSQGSHGIAIGVNAGQGTQGIYTVAIGVNAGYSGQLNYAVAIGSAAGETTQGTNSVAIGNQAGQASQNTSAIAIGVNAGNSGQLAKAVAIGESAGQTTQGTNSVAIGANAGQTGQLENAVAIGVNAGKTGQQGNAIAIGVNAGNATQGQNAIAMGSSAGVNQLMNAVAIGNEAGRTNQLENAVAIGNEAGKTNQKANAIAIGSKAGNTTQGTNTIAIGEFAGEKSQEASAIAIGNEAGRSNQLANAVAIGNEAGKVDQGANSIAIGNLAGQTSQIANSIIINASGVALNNTTSSGLFMKPIATSAGTTNLLRYDTGTSEITYTTTSLTTPGINTSGNIGINKAAGTVALDVNGSINFTGVINSNGSPVVFTPPGINSAGNIGINKAAGTAAALDVNGSVYVYAATEQVNALHIANGRLYTAQSVNICGNGSGANFTVGAPGGNSVTTLHGNVGIGVAEPGFPLHVATDIYCGRNATFAGNGAGTVRIGTSEYNNAELTVYGGITCKGIKPSPPIGDWTERATNLRWASVASSLTGEKLVAVAAYTGIYTSIDFGVTWNLKYNSPLNWRCVTSSSTGQYLAAVAYNGFIYISSDSGATWTPKEDAGRRQWNSIASSSTGQYFAAVEFMGNIYRSSTYGASWTQGTGAPSEEWISITSSSTGLYFAAISGGFGGAGGFIYRSVDSGTSWVKLTTAPNKSWKGITSSSDGSKLFVTGNNGIECIIYRSTDSGITWTLLPTPINSSDLNGITSSSDGTILAVIGSSGVYKSTNSGSTWTQTLIRYGQSISSSGDGIKLVAGCAANNTNGYIYIGYFQEKITLTGLIGIGTTIPRAPLDVIGGSFISYSFGRFFLASQSEFTLLNANISGDYMSIMTDNYVFSSKGFMAASDMRIKTNIKPVTDSLDIVNSLNIVSFDYIDFSKSSVNHGLIAQELQKVYPKAIVSTRDYIPSVFNLAISYTGDLSGVTIKSSGTHGFSVNDRIKLYINKDDNADTADFEYNTAVLEVISDTEFKVKAWDNFELNKEIFIYGKEVNDFLGVDKPLIGVLAAGACQVLSQQVRKLQEENLELRSTVQGILKENLELRSTVQAIIQKYPI